MNSKATPDGMCLSMHQPWASLLVHGIKRIEGRGWPTEHRGRLWIHSTSKQPSQEEIQELEIFYRGIHAMEGGDPSFPQEYPTSVLLGCVELVDCVTVEQVEAWEGLPESVRLEAGSPFCFLCERPQRLVVLHPMRGWPKLFPLEKKMLRIASMGLKPPPSSALAFSWGTYGTPPSASKEASKQRMAAQGRSARWQAGGGGEEGGRGLLGDATRGGGDLGSTACTAEAGCTAGTAQQVQQDPGKRLRAVQKKLRQIAVIAEKERAGGTLTTEERAKVGKAAELQAEARSLQQQLLQP